NSGAIDTAYGNGVTIKDVKFALGSRHVYGVVASGKNVTIQHATPTVGGLFRAYNATNLQVLDCNAGVLQGYWGYAGGSNNQGITIKNCTVGGSVYDHDLR